MSSFNLEQLGTLLLESGKAINQRIHDEFSTLSLSQIQEMANRAQELFLKSKAMFAQAVIELGKETGDALESLQEANAEIAHAIKTINTMQKIINIAAKLITVGGQVIAGDLNSIPSSVKDVFAELKK